MDVYVHLVLYIYASTYIYIFIYLFIDLTYVYIICIYSSYRYVYVYTHVYRCVYIYTYMELVLPRPAGLSCFEPARVRSLIPNREVTGACAELTSETCLQADVGTQRPTWGFRFCVLLYCCRMLQALQP